MNRTTLEEAVKDIEFVKVAIYQFSEDPSKTCISYNEGELLFVRYGSNDVLAFKADKNYNPVLYQDAIEKPYVLQSDIVRAAESIILEAAKQLGSNTSDEFKEAVREFRELVG